MQALVPANEKRVVKEVKRERGLSPAHTQPHSLGRPQVKALLTRIMDTLGLFLFPCPVYASPLRMLLDSQSAPLVSSYETLKLLCVTERRVYLGSQAVSAERKTEIAATRDRFCDRLAHYARRDEGGFARLLMMPQGVAATDAAWVKENFYNSLNVINVLEMTILDYLGIPESAQQPWCTYGLSALPASPVVRAACWRAMMTEMGRSSAEAEKMIAAGASWMAPTELRTLLERARVSLCGTFMFPCSGGCGAQEPAPRAFLRCSVCHWARYDSADCQRRHWPEHKKVCCKPRSLEDMDKGRILIGATSADASADAAPAKKPE